MSAFGENNQAGLSEAMQAIAKRVRLERDKRVTTENEDTEALPDVITFPYSRHSSYFELCHLVGTFKPKDVWPCTVDTREWLEKCLSVSIFPFRIDADVGYFRHHGSRSFRAALL